MIARDGLAGLSHRVVAREAGVPLAAVPYYYGSKEALVAAAIDHITDNEVRLVSQVVDQISPARVTPREAARAAAGLIRTLVEVDRGARLAHVEASAHAARQDPPLDAPQRWWEANVEVARAVLEAGGQPDPEVDAHLVFAAGFGLYFAALTAPEAMTDERLAACLERLLAALDDRDPSPRS